MNLLQKKYLINWYTKKCEWARLYQVFREEYEFIIRNKNKKIILTGTPIHGNLGDHAIALAEHQLIQKTLPQYSIIEISIPLMLRHASKFKEIIGDSLIIISGGGFIGSLWMDEERMIREVLRTYPNNKVIIFPQTVFYENSKQGKKVKNKSISIYRKHRRLSLCLREKISFQQAKQLVKKKDIHFIPDMGFFLDYDIDTQQRKDVLLCFRRDKESIFNPQTRNIILDVINENFDIQDIKYTDTVISRNVLPRERVIMLNRKLMEFMQAKIVITDRLHGMIFAAITSTPCIAINNKSKKIEGVYNIIKNIDYIKFIGDDDLKNINNTINELLNLKNIQYDINALKGKYLVIQKALINLLDKKRR